MFPEVQETQSPCVKPKSTTLSSVDCVGVAYWSAPISSFVSPSQRSDRIDTFLAVTSLARRVGVVQRKCLALLVSERWAQVWECASRFRPHFCLLH